jgi:hypothetical protein
VYKRVQDTIEESEGLDGGHGHVEGGVLDEEDETHIQRA